MRAPVPLVARWALVPVGANETEEKCFKLIESLKTDVGGGMREVFERPKLTSELLTSVL
jgi:hypothetical protein